jgi:hypothetical protein
MASADRVAREFELFGDFRCDLAVGDSEGGVYCFVEFEGAGPESIFRRQGEKATREWSPRFEHGYSQFIDWFYKLRDREKADEYEARFGKRAIDYEGLLVIGRDLHLDQGEKLRLAWRTRHVLVDSRRINCMTFDGLLRRLQIHLETLAPPAGRKRKRRRK